MGNSKNMNLGILDSINKKDGSIDKNISNDTNKNNSKNDTANGNNTNNNNNINNISNDKNKSGNRIVSNSNNENNNGNNIGNIVINKPIISDKPKRVSYYLRSKTISDIEKLAKKSGMGISEFLQYLLDITLDKIEIR